VTISNDSALKYYFTKEFTGTGIVGNSSGSDVILSKQIRVVVESVGGGNTVVVSGKLKGQASFVTLATIVGATTGTTVDTSLVDLILFNCTVYSASGGTPKLLASGFFKSPDVAATWGLIGGTITNQTDLINYLNTGFIPYSGATSSINLNTRNITMPSGTIKDAGGFDSINPNNHALYTAAGIPSVQYGTFELADSGAAVTVNFDSKTLTSAGNTTIDWAAKGLFNGNVCLSWETRQAFDSSDVQALDWQSRKLFGPTNDELINWDNINGGVYLYNNSFPGALTLDTGSMALIEPSSGVTTLNWGTTSLNDFSFLVSMDWNARQLYDTSSISSFDYGARTMYDPSGAVAINYSSGVRHLIDSLGTLSIDWENRTLCDGTGTTTWDWQQRTGFAPDALSIDWGNRHLKIAFGGTTTLDWGICTLKDVNGAISINWSNKEMRGSLNTLVASWPNTSLVIGGTTNTSNLGAIWYDTAQKAMQVRAAANTQSLQGVVFTQTATASSANSTAENEITSTGVGTRSLAADFFVVGKTLRISGRGFHSSTASPTLNVRIKIGSNTICTTGAHTHHNATNGYFDFDVLVTCRSVGAGGTFFTQGNFTDATDHVPMGNIATTSINTTVGHQVNVTAQWSAASASNTISLTNFTVEVLN